MVDAIFLQGDCLDKLKGIPDQSVSLVITSPPYADKRKSTYGGIHPDKYVDWFLTRSVEFQRVLTDKGTFILNIKEGVTQGERQTYVYELVLALRQQGWLWTEEFVWHKPNPFPGKWPNRFRDAWERCYQFNKQHKFYMNQNEVLEKTGSWAEVRLQHLSAKDKERHESQTGSGMGRNVSNWTDRKQAYPTNVRVVMETAIETDYPNILRLPSETGNQEHSAAFPVRLPLWFIKLFTNVGDTVLDPFSGSGTTGVACKILGRSYIGIDIHESNCLRGRKRWAASGYDSEVSDDTDNITLLFGIDYHPGDK